MTKKNPRVVGIILAGGKGKRFNASIPKQFMSLNGKLTIQHVVDNMKNSGIFSKIYIVGNSEFKKYFDLVKNTDEIFMFKPISRVDDILTILNKIEETEYVFIQDSVRPLTPPDHYKKMLVSLQSKSWYDFLITTQSLTDVLFHDEKTHISAVNRKDYYLGQCPELFRFNSLKKLKMGASSANSLSEYAYDNGLCGGNCDIEGNNTKITYDYQLFEIEQLLRFSMPKINHNPDLKGKKILLFGGSGNIGQEVKKYCEENGAIVYAPTRSEINLTESLLNYKIQNIYDCVIYSAGDYCSDKNLEPIYSDKILMDINFFRVIEAVHKCKTDWLTHGGSIIILGSTAGLAGRKDFSVYGATKAAVHNYVEAYSHNLLEHDIKINCIAPAKVVGKLQKTLNPNADESNMINPKDLAKIIASYINPEETGKIVIVPVGFEKGI